MRRATLRVSLHQANRAGMNPARFGSGNARFARRTLGMRRATLRVSLHQANRAGMNPARFGSGNAPLRAPDARDAARYAPRVTSSSESRRDEPGAIRQR